MTQDEIDKKALALVNEVEGPYRYTIELGTGPIAIALRHAIEQHEAFRREVSDAVKEALEHDFPNRTTITACFGHFILPKPVDPLVEVVDDVARDLHITGASTLHTFRSDDFRNALRAALAARGLKIVFEQE